MAGLIQLEHHAPARCAAVEGSAVEVARRVANHTAGRVSPVGPAREVVQHGLAAGGIQLEYHAPARCAAVDSSPVKVAGRVADHARLGIRPLRQACEMVQQGFSRRLRLHRCRRHGG